MRLKQLILILAAIYFCTGCKATRQKVVESPALPKTTTRLRAVETTTPKPFTIEWCYPASRENVVFEVWSTTDLTAPYQRAAETPDLIFSKPVDQKQEFFKVRAKNTLTGELSGWATNEPCP